MNSAVSALPVWERHEPYTKGGQYGFGSCESPPQFLRHRPVPALFLRHRRWYRRGGGRARGGVVADDLAKEVAELPCLITVETGEGRH